MSLFHALKKQYHVIAQPNPDDIIFAFQKNDIYLLDEKCLPRWNQVERCFNSSATYYCFAETENCRYVIVETDLILKHENYHAIKLKSASTILDETLFALAKYANHLHHWRRTHAYCGNCGNKNSEKTDEQAFICLHCQHVTYPRISPCIIVLITRGSKLLLARSPHFSEKVYSTLAGFVEPGESLEQALHREIKEEVGVTVSEITYFGSQPWPFPDSLMIGFHAKYLAGKIEFDGVEIEDAQWFDVHSLPQLPSSTSIARELIESHLKQYR